MTKTVESQYPNFHELKQVIDKLRDPKKGCPWDLKQTHNSLLKFLIEECYEFVHAAEEGDSSKMEDELGDILLQIMLHTKIGEEQKTFSFESVAKVLSEKMKRRHPHIFSPKDGDSEIKVDEVVSNWQEIKKREKKKKSSDEVHELIPHLDESCLAFPALFAANKIGEKTQIVGFDWDNYQEVFPKVKEEWKEFTDEIEHGIESNYDKIKEEFGDFLFSVAQLGRHLKINPEEALRDANKKFLGRFQLMERLIHQDNKGLKSLEEMEQSEMETYWTKAKMIEKKEKGVE
jgi:MazG family protein